ncbi:hypothetical protein GOP47_0000807 [Adiantum capillus-veneris]|uniref:Uncharacterized protein n=1 Tax=Adiantum capillus-veneris TaxID=13818 RepID=A0A9D4ZR23_ADICA|nr:hypothetical protein GOP47_0000807 [Adiantum capillus-veneris]
MADCEMSSWKQSTTAECRTSKTSLWKRSSSWVHRKTADLVQDYPALNVPNEPSLRARSRFLVTTLAIVGAFIAIFFVYHNSENSRTVRHWGSTYLLTLPTSQQNYPNLLCPCNKSSIPWPYFISFYWINQTADEHNSWIRYPITNYTQFCDPLNVVLNSTSGAWLQGCYLMAQGISSYTNVTMWSTISTTSVTAPSVLGHIISVQMQGAVADAFDDYGYLISSNSADWLQLLLVKNLIGRAAYRLVMSTKSMNDKNYTNDFYWRFFKGELYPNPVTGEHVSAFDITGKKVLVLEMDWTVYVHQCNPPYCDEVVRNSLLRRFLTAIIQVGGFAAIMMVLLRGALWPCIRWLNQWQ